jgi:hypothetical protein
MTVMRVWGHVFPVEGAVFRGHLCMPWRCSGGNHQHCANAMCAGLRCPLVLHSGLPLVSRLVLVKESLCEHHQPY